MKRILYIIIVSLCFGKNFIYTENSWYSILSPKEITSISYTRNEVVFSSSNGLFIYDKNSKDFFYSDYILNNLDNKYINIVHCDMYRDNIWIASREGLFFKSNLSSVWTKINFYNLDFNIRSVKNIGSNPDYIIIKTLNNKYIFLDPYTGLVELNMNDDIIELELMSAKWSSSSKDSQVFNLNNYYAFNGLEIISNNQIKKEGRILYITCILEEVDGDRWIGTNSGELFFISPYSNEVKPLQSIPPIVSMDIAYLDSNEEWWITDDEFLSGHTDILYTQESVFLYHWNENADLWTKHYQDRSPRIFSKDINDIYRLNDVLYIATNYGLVIYQLNSNKWLTLDTSDGLPSNIISKIEHYRGIVYLATMQGLAALSIKTNNIISTYLSGINYAKISDMAFLNEYLYIVSNLGLIKMDINIDKYMFISNKKFEKIDIKDEYVILLKNNNLYLLEDDTLNLLFNYQRLKDFDICNDYLWAHNTKSAIIYNIISNSRLEYNFSDGIVGSKINHVECDDQWVWFSTNGGLSFYNWSQFHYED